MNMQSVTPHPAFSFRITGTEAQPENAVPAAVLVQVLQNAQLAFALIGVHVEGRSIRERARIGAETNQRFQLQCKVPVAGSYVMPVTVGAAGSLFHAEQAEQAFGIFRALMQAVSDKRKDLLPKSLSDERIRRRVLEAVKEMCPRPGSGWALNLHDDSGAVFARLDKDTTPFLQEALVPASQREGERVVIGELKNIDFVEHRLTIIYPPTSKELDCLYEEELEDLLYEKRRDLIQVTGRVILDEHGQPKQIIDVSDIRDLDLDEIVLAEVQFGTSVVRAHAPIALDVFLDESKQLYCAEDTQIGISASSSTREGLFAELESQLAILWQEYALASDDELDGPAREMKRALLERFVEIADAS